MRQAPTVPSNLRKRLTLPLGLLLVFLGITLGVTQFLLQQAGKATTTAVDATTRLGRMPDAADALVNVLRARAQKREALQGTLSDLDAQLASIGKSTDSAQRNVALQIRLALVEVAGDLIGPVRSDTPAMQEVRSRISGIAATVAAQDSRKFTSRELPELQSPSQQMELLKEYLSDLEALQKKQESIIAELTQVQNECRALAMNASSTGIVAYLTSLGNAANASLTWTRWLVLLLLCSAIGCGLAAVIFTVRSITHPVMHLVDVARAVSRGKARKRASLEQSGDFRDLAEAFNQMLDARQSADERLKSAHDSLELKISARTAELWRANKALREEGEQRERMERELNQAQKMDALGKLAGSIAHDFNNLLTVIIGGAECIIKQLGPNHTASPLLHTVQQAGERAAGLTRPLLTFSRHQVLALEVVSLNEAADEASRMLRRLLGVNIDLRLNLAADLRPVKANANQLQQVLVNLGVNARDAMEGIGVLTIITRPAEVTAETAARKGAPAAEHWVELAVSDTGCGMDAATKARIFEPFFTTKPAGKGTGLGLATVFGIVKQSGGILEVDSEVGVGTTFRVFLPATEYAAVKVEDVPDNAPEKQASTGHETLLLVDDEEHIRELATMTLEERGYRVIAAADAEEAIIMGEKHRDEIDALISDVVMPGINGVQLAEMLSKIIPDLKVLFVSGHSTESISSESPLARHAEYLQKPYRAEALATKVREVLEGKGSQRASEEELREYSVWAE